jgi:hypothetical protein
MIHRIVAAGIALLGAGCLAAPLAISAGINPGSSGRFAATSLPLVNPGHPIPNPPSPPHSGAFHQHFAFKSFRRHEGFVPNTPLWWGYAGSGPTYYPPVATVPVETTIFDLPPQERSRPPVAYEPGCRTDAVTVPSESGGHRTINITRCY